MRARKSDGERHERRENEKPLGAADPLIIAKATTMCGALTLIISGG